MKSRVMRRSIGKAGSILMMIAMITVMTCSSVIPASAEEATNVHHLAFASDYHDTEGSVKKAMTGMPDDTEYVSLIGDMVGSKGGEHPAYLSSTILALVTDVFSKLTNSNVSMIWADHDMEVEDDATIVKCMDGRNSGQIYEGKNADGSTAYYIYGIGHYDMTTGGSTIADGSDSSATAADAFKKWSDSVDVTVPIIVLCHVPIHAKRGDNFGAVYWNEALNYAATGTEGINDTTKTGNIRRNVLFLHGHNHTCDETEYYYAAGSTMIVQEDTTEKAASLQSDDAAAELQAEDTAEAAAAAAGEDAELQADSNVITLGAVYDDELLTSVTASGTQSNIYYTSLTAGYLKTSGKATLMTIDDDAITLNKYYDGEKVSIGTDAATGTELGSEVVINRVVTNKEHSSVTVTKTDSSGNTLSGATFTLYDADDKTITTYEGGAFAISTSDAALASQLPAEGGSVTLKLKETKAPTGYTLSSTSHSVVISSSVTEVANDGVMTRTNKYTITIDGDTSAKIVNTKSSTTSSTTGSSGTTTSSKAVSSVPKTGDSGHLMLCISVAVLAAVALAVLVVKRRRKV